MFYNGIFIQTLLSSELIEFQILLIKELIMQAINILNESAKSKTNLFTTSSKTIEDINYKTNRILMLHLNLII